MPGARKKKFQLNGLLVPDSCFIYTKTYHLTSGASYKHRLYISPKYQLVAKHEVVDEDGNILGSEEAIGILY